MSFAVVANGSTGFGISLSAPVSEITGTASLGLAADLWTDGPKGVIPGKATRIEYTGVYRRPQYTVGTVFTYFQPVDVEAPPSALVGTADLAFTESATIAATGGLAASLTLTFDDGASTLSGAGALAGTSALVFSDSATLIALDGSISGAAALTVSLAATLGGAGALAGATALDLTGSATLGGSGALAGSGALQFADDATLVALDGGIDGAAELTLAATGTLTPPAGADVIPGGWYGARTPEQAQREREAARRDRDEAEQRATPPPGAAQAGPGPADDIPPAPAADLELVRSLVAFWTGEADRSLLNRRAQRALDYALRAESVLAMRLFERELARQMEEEEMALLLTLLADD